MFDAADPDVVPAGKRMGAMRRRHAHGGVSVVRQANIAALATADQRPASRHPCADWENASDSCPASAWVRIARRRAPVRSQHALTAILRPRPVNIRGKRQLELAKQLRHGAGWTAVR